MFNVVDHVTASIAKDVDRLIFVGHIVKAAPSFTRYNHPGKARQVLFSTTAHADNDLHQNIIRAWTFALDWFETDASAVARLLENYGSPV